MKLSFSEIEGPAAVNMILDVQGNSFGGEREVPSVWRIGRNCGATGGMAIEVLEESLDKGPSMIERSGVSTPD